MTGYGPGGWGSDMATQDGQFIESTGGKDGAATAAIILLSVFWLMVLALVGFIDYYCVSHHAPGGIFVMLGILQGGAILRIIFLMSRP